MKEKEERSHLQDSKTTTHTFFLKQIWKRLPVYSKWSFQWGDKCSHVKNHLISWNHLSFSKVTKISTSPHTLNPLKELLKQLVIANRELCEVQGPLFSKEAPHFEFKQLWVPQQVTIQRRRKSLEDFLYRQKQKRDFDTKKGTERQFPRDCQERWTVWDLMASSVVT